MKPYPLCCGTWKTKQLKSVPLPKPIEFEADYERITLILNRLLDVVRDDRTHPLHSLITLIGDLLEAYEANLEPVD